MYVLVCVWINTYRGAHAWVRARVCDVFCALMPVYTLPVCYCPIYLHDSLPTMYTFRHVAVVVTPPLRTPSTLGTCFENARYLHCNERRVPSTLKGAAFKLSISSIEIFSKINALLNIGTLVLAVLGGGEGGGSQGILRYTCSRIFIRATMEERPQHDRAEEEHFFPLR